MLKALMLRNYVRNKASMRKFKQLGLQSVKLGEFEPKLGQGPALSAYYGHRHPIYRKFGHRHRSQQ